LLKQLIHNGIIIPETPEYLGLSLRVRGQWIALSPAQEEMAMAWARKKDTIYVQDPVFAANFMRDFSAALGVEPTLEVREVDFGPCNEVVQRERAAKEAMTSEERKALAAQRKVAREALKAQYGFAIVNGQRVELGNYMAEPSGIFMGRGQHPLRGRWKRGARQTDVTLNLSPDAPRPDGQWAEIVWLPESLWVARWYDQLSDKLKYIWLSDTAPVKQQREASKFDKAIDLEARIDEVRAEIERGLADENPRRRMVATACYLIDALCLRVGDEKDPEEADTVGATTLRPEHVFIREDGAVEFKFLGKDSVAWHKTLQPPAIVLDNLRELSLKARPSRASATDERGHPTRDLPQLFPDVTSATVNKFLSSVMPGLSAKVFRTHHASMAVSRSLDQAAVRLQDPEYKKWKAATLANLDAAVLCNHTKQETGDWAAARERYRERQDKAEERLATARAQWQESNEKLAALKQEAKEKEEGATTPEERVKLKERYRKQIERARQQLAVAQDRRARAQVALDKIKAQALIAGKKRTWNLGTSLKSYIDPRIYHRWGRQVGYDVLERYYPTTLRRKFAWVRDEDEITDEESEFVVRTCMSEDLAAVTVMFQEVQRELPEVALPQTREEIGARFLPSLGADWREAIVALGEEQEVAGFAAIGPLWEHEGQPCLDVFAVIRAEQRDTSLTQRLADEIRRRAQSYQMQLSKKQLPIRPQEDSWQASAPDFLEALEAEDAQEE